MCIIYFIRLYKLLCDELQLGFNLKKRKKASRGNKTYLSVIYCQCFKYQASLFYMLLKISTKVFLKIMPFSHIHNV